MKVCSVYFLMGFRLAKRLVVAIAISASICALGQEQLQNVTPPSPTVANLAKYGDIPVSYYTGTPNISIPLYEIKTGDFSLPISLSYHASGIKVEDMASWVGLGWSLNAGGIVSRSMRGKQDENGGYMTSMDKISDLSAMSTENLEDLARIWYSSPSSMPDLEPDMFFYNFGSHSGKFYFNQDSEKFISIPQKAVFFDKDYFLSTGMWRIVLEDGAEYYFGLKEENTSFMNCSGSSSPPSTIVTGWFLTKIITPIAKEQITFIYETSSYTIRNIGSQTLNSSAGYSGLPACAGSQKVVCDSYNDYRGYRLRSIEYSRGRVEFISSTDRIDLLGDKRLDTVKIYNFSEPEPFKQFIFDYEYFNNSIIASWSGAAQDLSYLVRLKLKTITEVGSNGEELPPYRFSYEEYFAMPDRLSFDQDNWGFYNGPNGNADMIPPFIAGNLYFPGANRMVNELYTDVGIITSIEYPTGGSSLFEFENHRVGGYISYGDYSHLQPRIVYLDATDSVDAYNPIYYETVVVNNQMGSGVYMSFIVEGISCNDCFVSTTCASMSLSNGSFSVSIMCDRDDVFIPNGVYLLKADFTGNLDPQSYEEFVIRLTWSEFTGYDGETVVGGLRIKKIIQNYDGFSTPKTTLFDYNTIEGHSTAVMAYDRPVYEYPHYCRELGGDSDIGNVYIVRTSYSNIPLAVTQGSHLGYGQVSVRVIDSTSNGKTVYHYTRPNDFPDEYAYSSYHPNSAIQFNFNGGSLFPFPPATSFDHKRGLLILQEDYIFANGEYSLQKSTQNTFESLFYLYPDSVLLYDKTLGLKIGALTTTGGSSSYDYPVFSIYKTISEWIRPVKTVERFYNPGESVAHETITILEHQNAKHLQPTRVTTFSSDNSERVTYNKYPLDYYPAPSGTADKASLGIKYLQDRNFISPVIESYTTLKHSSDSIERVIGAVITRYYDTIPIPHEIFTARIESSVPLSSYVSSRVDTVNGSFIIDSSYEKRIEFLEFDTRGNLLQQRKNIDVFHSYLWGYDASYPIAAIVNAPVEDCFHTSFEDETENVSATALTGDKSRNTSYTVNPPGTGTRVLTYWKKIGAGSWEFVETTISSSTVIGGSGIFIDEVRVYPPGAQMTTYTYAPGIGMTSQTDANNVTSYYEYDSFGRLRLIKDDNGNVLQHYTYNYKQN